MDIGCIHRGRRWIQKVLIGVEDELLRFLEGSNIGCGSTTQCYRLVLKVLSGVENGPSLEVLPRVEERLY